MSNFKSSPSDLVKYISFELKVVDSDNDLGQGIHVGAKSILSWSEVDSNTAYKDTGIYGKLKFEKDFNKSLKLN